MRQITYCIPVFHAYVPLGHEGSLEERYLFEYLADALFPLLRVFEGLENEGIRYGFTLSLSPILAGMLENPTLMLRFADYIDWRIEVAEQALQNNPEMAPLIKEYVQKFKNIRYWHVERYRYRPLKAIFSLAALGNIEVIFASAGNGIIPVLEGVKSAVTAEVRASVSEYKVFSEGAQLQGFWLTELAYSQGCEDILAAEGIKYFLVDESAFTFAGQPLVDGCAKPVLLQNGMVAFAVNNHLSSKVARGVMAYCFDPNYAAVRDDVFQDIALATLPEKLWLEGSNKVYTGIDIYSAGGGLYLPGQARQSADQHAEHYLSLLIEEAQLQSADDGVVIMALEHEAVGRGWKELPVFIDMLLRKMRFDQDMVEATTPGAYLESARELQQAVLADSCAAGEGVFAEFYAHERERFLPELHLAAKRFEGGPFTDRRIGDQMARELLLAQGCEWRYYQSRGIDEEYARRRQKQRLARFAACDQIMATGKNMNILTLIEHDCEVLSSAGIHSFTPC